MQNQDLHAKEFAEALLKEMAQQVADTATSIADLALRTATKTNDNQGESIIATFKDGGNISPSIYVRPMYDQYMHGGTTIEELARDGIRVLETGYEQSKSMNFSDVSINAQDAREHLYLQLINGAANPGIREQCPHIEVQDLIAVPRWSVYSDEGGIGSVLITHDIQAGMLRMTDEEVLKIARENTLSKDYTVKGMSETMRELIGGEMSEEMREALFPIPDGPEQMYIMSNPEKLNGATVLLSKDTLAEAHDKIGEDFFIIPSSLHEVICVPESFVSDPRDLQNMCREVNETQVELQDRLGDNIYLCDGRNITICNSLEQLHDIRESAAATVTESISEGIGRRI